MTKLDYYIAGKRMKRPEGGFYEPGDRVPRSLFKNPRSWLESRHIKEPETEEVAKAPPPPPSPDADVTQPDLGESALTAAVDQSNAEMGGEANPPPSTVSAFTCRECGKACKSEGGLRSHMRIHE
jgi:hypothetical protein